MKIEIFGQGYNLQGGNEKGVAELAQFVDEQMHRVAEATHQVDTTRVAVLAALNIADELFALRRENEALAGPIRDRARKSLALVDRLLERSA